jgi:hypothetical protein
MPYVTERFRVAQFTVTEWKEITMSINIKQMMLLIASATGIGALGVFIVPAPQTQAAPCGQWGFTGQTHLQQSNNWAMFFTSTGTTAQGRADGISNRFGGGSPPDMHGSISGGIDGSTINLEVQWDNGPVGKYTGSVGADGFAHGTTYDAKNPGSKATWDSSPLTCIAAPPAPAAPPPPPPAPPPAQAPAAPPPAPAPAAARPDADDDGLYDDDETDVYGTDPHKADTDGDGVGDGQEVENGTNPLIPFG